MKQSMFNTVGANDNVFDKNVYYTYLRAVKRVTKKYAHVPDDPSVKDVPIIFELNKASRYIEKFMSEKSVKPDTLLSSILGGEKIIVKQGVLCTKNTEVIQGLPILGEKDPRKLRVAIAVSSVITIQFVEKSVLMDKFQSIPSVYGARPFFGIAEWVGKMFNELKVKLDTKITNEQLVDLIYNAFELNDHWLYIMMLVLGQFLPKQMDKNYLANMTCTPANFPPTVANAVLAVLGPDVVPGKTLYKYQGAKVNLPKLKEVDGHLLWSIITFQRSYIRDQDANGVSPLSYGYMFGPVSRSVYMMLCNLTDILYNLSLRDTNIRQVFFSTNLGHHFDVLRKILESCGIRTFYIGEHTVSKMDPNAPYLDVFNCSFVKPFIDAKKVFTATDADLVDETIIRHKRTGTVHYLTWCYVGKKLPDFGVTSFHVHSGMYCHSDLKVNLLDVSDMALANFIKSGYPLSGQPISSYIDQFASFRKNLVFLQNLCFKLPIVTKGINVVLDVFDEVVEDEDVLDLYSSNTVGQRVELSNSAKKPQLVKRIEPVVLDLSKVPKPQGSQTDRSKKKKNNRKKPNKPSKDSSSDTSVPEPKVLAPKPSPKQDKDKHPKDVVVDNTTKPRDADDQRKERVVQLEEEYQDLYA